MLGTTLVLTLTLLAPGAVDAAGATIAASPSYHPAPVEILPAYDDPTLEDTIIAYDILNEYHAWVSPWDSWGSAVRFTPSRYPCQVLGARAAIYRSPYTYYIYLRVHDDDGTSGRPGTILANQQRNDIPGVRDSTMYDYLLTSPVTISSGEFFLDFWNRRYPGGCDMYFWDDAAMNYPTRQWWYLYNAGGWVPAGNYNGRDMHIRALVRYPDANGDVGCTRIISPAGTVDTGASVTPACSVFNYGPGSATYSVRMRIGTGYDTAVQVSGHAPGTGLYVTFPTWNASPLGTIAATCSTRMTSDTAPANDRTTGSVFVAKHAVSALAIIAPLDTIPPGAVTPAARIRNQGNLREPLDVTFSVTGSSPFYSSTINLAAGLPIAADTVVSFPDWNASTGAYSARCSVYLAGDPNRTDDTVSAQFIVYRSVTPGWTEMARLPDLPSGRQAKDGGWLSFNAGNGLVYGAKGNKAADFYSYLPARDSWRPLAVIPDGREAKKPGKGATGCADGSGVVYAAKGNNSSGFYRYVAAVDSWYQLTDVPLGTSNKKVKGGADLAYVPGETAYCYLLKGYKNEFWRYNPALDSWTSLPTAPAAKYDAGSWLVHDAGLLYAHQAKYHALHVYDIAAGTWSTARTGMPLVGRAGKSKKSKDGGCAALLDEYIYALKGGNTQEFWRYAPATDSWLELDTMPQFGTTQKKKKVKAGADITTTVDYLLALKGNKTNEFWRYVPMLDVGCPAESREVGPMAGVVESGSTTLSLVPSLTRSGFVNVRLPVAETHSGGILRAYDAAGRLTLQRSVAPGSQNLSLDVNGLQPGAYIVRLTTTTLTGTARLVIPNR